MGLLGAHEGLLGYFQRCFVLTLAREINPRHFFCWGKVDKVLFQLKCFKSALLFEFTFYSETESHFILN